MWESVNSKPERMIPKLTSRSEGLLWSFALGLLLSAFLCSPRSAEAQFFGGPTTRAMQLGVGVSPSVGMQVGYVRSRSFYTTESAFYLDASPGFLAGDETMLVSGGLGGTLRLLDLLRSLEITAWENYHVDVGLRFGPSLRFRLDRETAASKNTRFHLFLERFARLVYRWRPQRHVFAELGTLRPYLRAGLRFQL